MKLLAHIGIVTAALALCLGLPALLWAPRGSGTDAVSGASLDIPAQPSGEYVVILNRDRHDVLADWEKFFTEREMGVIMEDLNCVTAQGDAAGLQLAQRYQARLAEHQMDLRSENGVLLVSRAERGMFDAVILSKEMAVVSLISCSRSQNACSCWCCETATN